LESAQDRVREGCAELAAEGVRLAMRALAVLVGKVDVETVLGEVFARFCIGK
jgi:tRNA modification GTPase